MLNEKMKKRKAEDVEMSDVEAQNVDTNPNDFNEPLEIDNDVDMTADSNIGLFLRFCFE